jgi:hypothetical protein
LANESLKEGDPFIVQTTASSISDGYLYLDHVDSESQTIHLLPGSGRSQTPVKAGQKIVLGKTEGWVVSPPHGLNMIVAIQAPSPLFESKRDEEEPLRRYLPELATALQTLTSSVPKSEVSVTFTIFATREQ